MINTESITVKFGGLVAVNNVSMHIEKNKIHAVIGPNGAGKSTLFNAISGIHPPNTGTISFLGEEITNLTPDKIARKGIGRTFQNIKLFSTLSVLENVLAGCHINIKSNVFQDMFGSPTQRLEAQTIRDYSMSLLEMVGLEKFRNFPARSLPYGAQRKLEIVRAMASKPEILLLDEPAAGMNPSETEELMHFIKSLCDGGLTILLIEHHVRMVMSLADTISVLDHGIKIAEGNAATVQNNDQVIEAYLGKAYRRES